MSNCDFVASPRSIIEELHGEEVLKTLDMFNLTIVKRENLAKKQSEIERLGKDIQNLRAELFSILKDHKVAQ